ncbi:MAG: AbrB/MazE/SpoVT family DNA-binding domain-containing protein [Candidatus Thiodiazotropha sp. (ex Ustalcina ferruginea)]|nr:AbrB/MazE/SpoVT family DNA-binding domain-containing protein [Candidatus Thiodiazotropha sp. (ex Ustalcina ferruginea)]
MHALKLRKIGSSIGVILPKEMLERLHLREGDKLYADESRNGVQLSPYDPEFEAAMEAFSRTRRKYRNALRELAK